MGRPMDARAPVTQSALVASFFALAMALRGLVAVVAGAALEHRLPEFVVGADFAEFDADGVALAVTEHAA